MEKIRICIEHINEIFGTEDLATQIDFGTLRVTSNPYQCALLDAHGLHLAEPIDFNGHIYPLYCI